MDDKAIAGTPYDRLNRTALAQLSEEYDTDGLLRSARDLAEFLCRATSKNGCCDQLFRLHAMANTAINGDSDVDTSHQELTALAYDLLELMSKAAACIRECERRIEPLMALQTKEADDAVALP